MILTSYASRKPYLFTLLLLFSFFLTKMLNAQTCNYCNCNRTVTVNSIVYGNCLDSGEIGNEEYTVLVNGICFTEDGGGTITGNYNTQVFNGCQDNLTLTGQAWEDDRGGRCDLNINGGAFDNDDDNVQNESTSNICILQPGTGTFTFGCVTVNYTIDCTVANQDIISNLNGNTTACSTSGNTATVSFTAENDVILNGEQLNYGVAVAGTVANPYGATFATSGNANAAGGNVSFDATIPVNITCAPVIYDVFLYLSPAAVASTCLDNTCQDFVTQTVTIWPDPNQFTVIVTATDNTCSYTLGVQECPAYTVTPANFTFVPGTVASTQNVVINAPAGSACTNANTTVNIAACALNCPDIAPNITTQDICSGGSPDFTVIETEVNATGANQGIFTYFTDAAFTTPYGGSLTNQTCTVSIVTLFGRLQCSVAPAGSTEEFDDFQFTVNVYPDANNFIVTENTGSCGVSASVNITAENGDVCFTNSGNAPTDPGCDNPDDVQDLTYAYNPNFSGACNLVFAETIAASCATTFTASAPAFTCPPAETDLCAEAGVFNLLPLDNNNVAGATGFFTGTGAGYVIGDANPNGDASIDLATVPLGIALTLTYNVQAPSCPASSTTNTCTFTVVRNCEAEGGFFGND